MIGRKRIDRRGLRYGLLIVVRMARARSSDGHVRWVCRCDCGNRTVVSSDNLRDGGVRSCGCLTPVAVSLRNTTHGMSHTAVYHVWDGMLYRCYSETSKDYPDYGGRGITVCRSWHTFENFYSYMGDIPDGLSLDRTDNNGPYSRENCRWATRRTQCNNTRRQERALRLTYRGVEKTITEWSALTGIPYNRIHMRITKYGYTVARALNHYSGSLGESDE